MSLGMNAVKCSANVRLFKELEEQTYASLSNPTNWIINKVNSPYTLEVEVTEIVMADLIELMPFIERISSRKIRFTHPDFTTVYKALQAITVMTGSVGQYY
jgi:D-aminopeptidase